MSNVSRRGFLGALAAFAAAVASGKTMPPSIAGGPPTPEQSGIMATLKDCRVRRYSNCFNLLEPSYFEVEYVYAPGAPETGLDRYAVERIKGLRPVAITDSRMGPRIKGLRPVAITDSRMGPRIKGLRPVAITDSRMGPRVVEIRFM